MMWARARTLTSYPLAVPRRVHASSFRLRNRKRGPVAGLPAGIDRKSTRLNSSHITNSYAVFCLKKKRSQGYRGRWLVRLGGYTKPDLKEYYMHRAPRTTSTNLSPLRVHASYLSSRRQLVLHAHI